MLEKDNLKAVIAPHCKSETLGQNQGHLRRPMPARAHSCSFISIEKDAQSE